MTMAGDGYRVGVLGATGAVGSTILELLAERGFPAAEVVPFASERSAGTRARVERLDARVPAAERRRRSRASTSCSPRPAARSAPSGRRGWSRPAPSSSTTPATGACTTTCRWSSPRSTPRRSTATTGSSPTPTARRCRWSWRWRRSTDAAGLERLVVSTYQAVSGTGKAAIEELRAQSRAVLAGEEPPAPQVYPHQIAFNVAAPGRESSRTATTTPPRSAR